MSDRIGLRVKLHDLHVLMAVVQAGNMSKADTPHAVALDDMSRPRAHVVGIASQNAPTLPPTGH